MVLLANKLIDLAFLANVLVHLRFKSLEHLWIVPLIRITDQVHVNLGLGRPPILVSINLILPRHVASE